jgi:hypothetical protein
VKEKRLQVDFDEEDFIEAAVLNFSVRSPASGVIHYHNS